jgi:serine phosphatase RsbU (regulator of sigma subunit)
VVERPNGDGHDTHLIVGDVAGHGADSAAIGVQLRACWRALVEADVAIAEIAQTMNRILLSRPAAQFATAVILQVCPEDRTLHLVNAGHPAPLLVRGDGLVEPLPQGVAPPLGVAEDVPYAALDVTLPPVAWSLVAYSDGLVEGRGAARRAFPPSALVRTLASFGPPLAQRDLQELLLLADTATGGTLQDDVVILALSPAPEDAGVPA